VQAIRHKWGSHELNFETDGVDVAIQYGDFRGRHVKKFLIDKGWPLLWSGQPWNIRSTVVTSLPKPRVPKTALIFFAIAMGLVAFLMTHELLPGWLQRRFDFVYFGAIIGAFVALVFGGRALTRNK
jgi:hypothetical protein